MMQLLYPPKLNNTSKEEIKNYFLNTFTFFESIFDLLKEEAFYIKSEPTRHPMIFYYGHTAVFYINKLIISNLIPKRINPHFESIFAVGVDEMEWDNLDENAYKWPSLDEVKSYRQKVKEVVLEFIDNTPLTLPLTWENPFWIILMGCEHERIHIETSSVLHRQMPLQYIQQNDRFTPNPSNSTLPKNELLHVKQTTITLGKPKEHFYYGWDNEYGTYTQTLQSFKVSKYLVSNGEFLEFVEDNGYERLEFWDEEGKAFLQRSKATHPHFWRKTKNGYLYRAYDREIPLPLDFPVDVNALEAEAFCRWKSHKENKHYQLISEAEYRALYDQTNLGEIVDEKLQNVNFAYGFSSTPVTRFETDGVFDICGNAWCWSRTPIDGFEGFEVHPAYDDFSTPTFDNKHNIIVGASWASSGNLIMKHSRYAFRKHFFQHASFRYVLSSNPTHTIDPFLETDTEVIQKIKEEYLANTLSEKLKKFQTYFKGEKALVMGCGVGRIAFEIAPYFEKVEAIDATARYIKVGVLLQKRNYIKIQQNDQTSLIEFDTSKVAHKVQFWQGDENNLKPHFHGYDFVLYMGENPKFLNTLDHITTPTATVITLKDISTLKGFTKISQGVFRKSSS